VLRNGKKITTQNVEDCTQEKIVEWMIGSKNIGGIRFFREAHSKEVVLEASGISQNGGIVKDVSFKIHKGEIVGLAGVVGSGRTETAQILFGANKYSSGTVTVDGRTEQTSKNTPEKSAKMRMGYIPEDRKSEGLIATGTIQENMGIVAIDGLRRHGIIQFKEIRRIVGELISKLNVKCTSQMQDAMSLSGGNQQKVVIGKWLAVDPVVLIMDQPTRGIDIGAKNEIYSLINELAKKAWAYCHIGRTRRR
jgi:ribose transport system ATP-binding protein